MRLLTSLVLCVVLGGVQQRPSESALAALEEGIRQVDEGDFETALITLDGAVRQLLAEEASEDDLAQAYLYLGVVYLGLGQEPLAQAKFREALRHDEDLNPSRGEFSPRVIRGFAAAREQQDTTVQLQQEASRGWKRGGAAILLGGAAAGAGATLATVVRERENLSPSTPTITVTPEGVPLWGATLVSFAASATDPEGDVLEYQWDFNEATAAGSSATHRFTGPGHYTVQLTVSDGLAEAQAEVSVTVGTLEGTWRTEARPFGAVEYTLMPGPGGERLNASYLFPDGRVVPDGHGVIAHPRELLLVYADQEDHMGGGCCPRECKFVFRGEADPSLEAITGTLTAQNAGWLHEVRCPFNGQSYPLTLRR